MDAVLKSGKQPILVPLACGIVLGVIGVLAAVPNGDGRQPGASVSKGWPPEKGLSPPFPATNRRPSPVPETQLQVIDETENDSVLLISKYALSADNARWIVDLPLPVLSRWLTLDAKSALPWLFKNSALFPGPKLHQVVSLANVPDSGSLSKRIRENSKIIPEDFDYLLTSANIRAALSGEGGDLGLESGQLASFLSLDKYSEKLLYLSTLDDLEPGMMSQVLKQLSIIDSRQYIEACDRAWPSLITEEKSTQLNRLIPLYEKGEGEITGLENKFLDYYRGTERSSDSTPERVIASVIKNEGAARALDLVSRMSEKPVFDRDNLLGYVNPIILSDPGAASEWLNSTQNETVKNSAIEVLVATLGSSPELALPWINQSTDAIARERMLKTLSEKK